MTLTPHNPDEILEESSDELGDRLEQAHYPEVMTHAQLQQFYRNPVAQHLIDLFNGTAFHKGQADICQQMIDPRNPAWTEKWDLPVYIFLFIVNGFLVYRGIQGTLSDLPLLQHLDDEKKAYVLSVVGILLGGALGLAIEIAIGKVLFVKFSLKWFCYSKLHILIQEARTRGQLYPIRRARLDGKITLCKGIFSDKLKISLSRFDYLLIGSALLGLGIDCLGAQKTIAELSREAEKLAHPAAKQSPDVLQQALELISYIPAALPAVVVLMVAIILGYLVYFPRELNLLSEQFKAKLNDFDPYEIRYLVDCNNKLYEFVTCNNDISHKTVRQIKIANEIEYLRDCCDRVMTDSLKLSTRVALYQSASRELEVDQDENVDADTSVEMQLDVIRRETYLKVVSLNQRIQDLEAEQAALNSGQGLPQEN